MNHFLKSQSVTISLISLVLSFVVAWLLLPIKHGFPMVPFFILFTSFSTMVYFVRKNRTWFDTLLYLGILALSFLLIYHANGASQFITFLFIIVFGSLLVLPLTDEHTLPTLLLTPLFMMKEALTRRTQFPYQWSVLKNLKRTGSIQSYIPSILITLLFLGVTMPLLASANPFFNELLQNLLHFFNLTWLLHYFTQEQITINFVRFCLFIFLAYAIPRTLTAGTNDTTLQKINVVLPVNYLIPKVAMGILLVIFFITQAQLYFASPSLLQSIGYTNSRLTNEVFFQVTIVAFIIFFLAYLDNARKSWNRKLTYFLLIEAFFLVGIAFKSVFDYSSLWGLTEKRLWGYATMSWLTGALLLFLYYYVKQIPLLRFFRLITAYTIIILIGINIANFDYLIAHYSKARTQNGTDYEYLSSLSPDAHSYNDTLQHLVRQIETGNSRDTEKVNAANALLRKIDYLQQKYNSGLPYNSFNISEYAEYRNILHVDTEKYRRRLNIIDRKYNDQSNTPAKPTGDIPQ